SAGHVPQSDRCLAEPIVAGLLAGRRAFHALRHSLGERAVLDHLDEGRGGVSEVEEVTLPRPLEVAAVAEPAAPDTGDDVLASVCALRVGYLLPEADHLALALVDQDVLIRVRPPVESAHLLAERDLSDLVTADRP